MSESSYVGIVKNPEYKGRRVGFSGTRQGMTDAQKEAFSALIRELGPTEFHHGDAIGADAEAADAVNQLLQRPKIICHPCYFNAQRAWTKFNDEKRPVRDTHVRNRRIVAETDLLVGCPKSMKRLQSTGTWHTIGEAEGKGKPRFVVWPDGTITQPEEEIPNEGRPVPPPDRLPRRRKILEDRR